MAVPAGQGVGMGAAEHCQAVVDQSLEQLGRLRRVPGLTEEVRVVPTVVQV